MKTTKNIDRYSAVPKCQFFQRFYSEEDIKKRNVFRMKIVRIMYVIK